MTEYVTFATAGQLFGLPIEYVRDVFTPANITRVPLAGCEIAGVLNLRGRIITVIDLANLLHLEAPEHSGTQMVIGIERGSESFGILVDRAGEVLSFSDADLEPIPPNLDPALDAIAAGVFRLDNEILVALDADRTLGFQTAESPAATVGRANAAAAPRNCHWPRVI